MYRRFSFWRHATIVIRTFSYAIILIPIFSYAHSQVMDAAARSNVTSPASAYIFFYSFRLLISLVVVPLLMSFVIRSFVTLGDGNSAEAALLKELTMVFQIFLPSPLEFFGCMIFFSAYLFMANAMLVWWRRKRTMTGNCG